MNCLGKLTIIIPTHYRHEYLNRILSYYEGSKFKILVADSTNVKYKNTNGYDIDYFHYPDEIYLFKMHDIVNKVKTPYMLFCADDDFWVKESIPECVDFLDDNADYSSIHGKYIIFKEESNIEFLPIYFQGESIESDSIEERLLTCMDNYIPFFYALHRTQVIKKMFNDNYATNISHAILNELAVNYYSLIYGKHKVVDILTYARDNQSTPTSVGRENLRIISMQEKFKDEFNQFRLNLKKIILDENVNLNSEKIVESSINRYLNQIDDSNSIKEVIKKYFSFLLPFLKYLRDKKNRKRILKIYQNTKGYPILDKEAIEAWKNIKKIIKNHKY